MKIVGVFIGVLLAAQRLTAADPLIASWFKLDSSNYARIYPDDSAKMAGRTATTWSNGRLAQSEPAYSGVQAIFSSPEWVYVMSTGLAGQVMGPWFDDPQHWRTFPNLPTDQHYILRLPRHPIAQSGYEFNHLGEIGMTVDGIRIFDANDAFSYSHEAGRDASPRGRIGRGDGIWNRDAYVNERLTFDAALAHQQNSGRYHYHAEPVALRYLLGDHVDFNPATKTYRESKTPPTRHSPIIGWMQDGYPLYGPYGFADAKDPKSGVRRMVSGYVLRDGANGADDLRLTGRRKLPAWEARELDRPAALEENETGPAVNVNYPLGHYLEDYAYLGDLATAPGRRWDLDEFNGRWCVTPEFPQGTYAYFTAIDAAGRPIYPYNMGRRYRGVPSGRLVRAITEPVTTNFMAHADLTARRDSGGSVSLVWKSNADGGNYEVQREQDFGPGPGRRPERGFGPSWGPPP